MNKSIRDNYPYQIVAFLDEEPKIGEKVYGGLGEWFPQIALKRRFRVNGEAEADTIERIDDFLKTQKPLEISVGELVKPERMPVRILEVAESSQIMNFHHDLIAALGNRMVSRYPERDGDNYLPHITAEYRDKFVIDFDKYKNRKYTLAKLCLLKDIQDKNSVAYKYFTVGSTEN